MFHVLEVGGARKLHGALQRVLCQGWIRPVGAGQLQQVRRAGGRWSLPGSVSKLRSHSLVQFTALDTQSLPHTLQVSKSHEAEHIAAGCSSFGRVVAADIGTPIGSIPPAVCEVTGALIDAELLEIDVDLGATRLFIMHNKYPRL